MGKSTVSFKMTSAAGIGLSAVLIAVCVIMAGEHLPGANAQFGRGVGRFFRNFRRGATRVFRPVMRPVQAISRPQQFTSPTSGPQQFTPQSSRRPPQSSRRPVFSTLPQR